MVKWQLHLWTVENKENEIRLTISIDIIHYTAEKIIIRDVQIIGLHLL